MNKIIRTFSLLYLLQPIWSASALPTKVFNLNVFDQLQGKWESTFREKRIKELSSYIHEVLPDVVVFQEAQGTENYTSSKDSSHILKLYPYQNYLHEMTGADGESYGYWIGAKEKPLKWIHEKFFFDGGVDRRVQGAIWKTETDCLGLLSLHLSYQNSAVRVKEADWIVNYLRQQQSLCNRWLVLGDFNADDDTEEMRVLFSHGLKSSFKVKKPTVGAFNPIRRIYGENIPSKTIDWALEFGRLSAEATVVLDHERNGLWLSDHAGILVELK
ncbi:MAG: endonuclease/exonuclease/phosphatase family protein [Oligoflexia bacterium]|nr:endonuclease/exonuclease/phosphatase family protein [Oligoflexia bacterium]